MHLTQENVCLHTVGGKLEAIQHKYDGTKTFITRHLGSQRRFMSCSASNKCITLLHS